MTTSHKFDNRSQLTGHLSAVASRGGGSVVYFRHCGPSQTRVGAKLHSLKVSKVKTDTGPPPLPAKRQKTRRSNPSPTDLHRRTGELNGSLSGSARLILVLADCGKSSVFDANRPYWPLGISAGVKKLLTCMAIAVVTTIVVLALWPYQLVASPHSTLRVVDGKKQPVSGLRIIRAWDTSEGQKGQEEARTDTKGEVSFKRVAVSMKLTQKAHQTTANFRSRLMRTELGDLWPLGVPHLLAGWLHPKV